MIFEFNKTTEDFLKIITKNAQIQKMRVFFVGGIVRDNILNIKNDDIDLLIEGSAIDFAEKLPESIKIKSIHKDFNTVKLGYGNLNIDLASTRVESYVCSGALPTILKTGVKIDDDVKRRDFSVNSLYCELKLIDNNLTYELIDLVKGLDDINNKTLRVLHDKSYIDDPTRILRGLNFKYRFGFDFSDSDKKLIKSYINSLGAIDNSKASYDRIYNVFYKNLKSEFNLAFFNEIIEKNYYKIIFNELSNVDLTFIEEIINDFSLNNKSNSETADFLISVLKNETVEKLKAESLIDIYKEFSSFKKAELAYYFYKTKDKNAKTYLEIKDIKLLTTGQDLINLNYPKGKLFKEIMEAALNYKLNHPKASKEDELNFIKKEFPQKNFL